MRYPTILLMAWLLAISAACAHGPVCEQPDLASIAGSAVEIPAPEDLEHVLRVFLDAHCRCQFSEEFKERVSFGHQVKGEDHEIDQASCLGPIEVVGGNLTGGVIVAFELKLLDPAHQRQYDGLYLMTAVYSGEKWSIYSVEPLLETLH